MRSGIDWLASTLWRVALIRHPSAQRLKHIVVLEPPDLLQDLACGYFLLEALAKLRAKDDSIHLVVIGKPKYDSKATQLIKELNLAESIEFVSGVTDQRIVELYNEAEVAIVPSLYEGFSLPAIEAMSCGVPLVATTGGALPEVVGADGVTALQVPPGDSDALAQKIGWALEQTNLRSVVGAAGRERVIQNFSWKITAERTVEHYRALLAEVSANAHS